MVVIGDNNRVVRLMGFSCCEMCVWAFAQTLKSSHNKGVAVWKGFTTCVKIQCRFDAHACIQDGHLKNIKVQKNWLIAPKNLYVVHV